jgi:hypothetical protein
MSISANANANATAGADLGKVAVGPHASTHLGHLGFGAEASASNRRIQFAGAPRQAGQNIIGHELCHVIQAPRRDFGR